MRGRHRWYTSRPAGGAAAVTAPTPTWAAAVGPCTIRFLSAPVAQLDRAPPSGGGSQRFDKIAGSDFGPPAGGPGAILSGGSAERCCGDRCTRAWAAALSPCTIRFFSAPVAQLDRAPPSGGGSQRFESSRARQTQRAQTGPFCLACRKGLRTSEIRSAGSTKSPGAILDRRQAGPEGEGQGLPAAILSGAPNAKGPNGPFLFGLLKRASNL